ncbi:hypothetical protein [Falsiroseomonas ponticola]|uniref:hypothetical protein n=1 Tax=Falsiroseomonas ponticola TaxID=2786951 RepID=UPI001934090D|nr:hypothetical protein [Roseomonas ponticola]
MSLFFGAGAEVGYDMPTGGRFALEIFRRPLDGEREIFQKMRASINPLSTYATKWLPKDYASKRVNVFGKSEKTTVFESSLEYKRHEIKLQLDRYDEHALYLLRQNGISEREIDDEFAKSFDGRRLGAHTFGGVVRLNDRLGASHKIFETNYFSAMLDLLSNKALATPALKKYVRATLQLYVGALGQDLVSSLNHELFTHAPANLAVFDDLDGLFRLEHIQAGLEAYELIMEPSKPPKLNPGQSLPEVFEAIAFGVLDSIMSSCLDYQALMDGHFRYLYAPQEWAKFCKISIFLHSVRSYIVELESKALANLSGGDGYYHDIAKCVAAGGIAISGVGTANYTSLFNEVMKSAGLGERASFLNGSVGDYYDPYRNSILAMENDEVATCGRFVVPFLFTQSGIKPLTTVEMSRRYVQFYDAMDASDAVVVAGFGFNGDDSHINGMFRQLIESAGSASKRKIFLCWYCDDVGRFDERTAKLEVCKKLRVENLDGVTLVPVGRDRKTVGGSNWLDHIVATLAVAVDLKAPSSA